MSYPLQYPHNPPTSLSLPDHYTAPPPAHVASPLATATPPPAPLRPTHSHPSVDPYIPASPHTKRPPTNSQDEAIASPPKRVKLEDDPSSLPPPLQRLPTSLLYLTLAQSLHTAALSLLPNSSSAATSLFQRYLRAEVALLRKVLERSEGGKVELEARLRLLDVLDMCQGTDSEASRVASKGTSLSQSHPNLHPYYPHFLLTPTATTNPKFTRTTLKRALSSITPSTSSSATTYYTLSLYLSTISDFTSAINTLKDVERVAAQRGDASILWTTKILLAWRCISDSRPDVASPYISEIANRWWGSEAEAYHSRTFASPEEKKSAEVELAKLPKPEEIDVPRALKVMFIVVYCLFWADKGGVKRAKERLKEAHGLLDEKEVGEEEAKGVCEIRVGTEGDAVRLKLDPRSTLYSFAFLVSVAIHRDPFGKKPRALLFADEGLRLVNNKLSGLEALPSSLLPHQQTLHLTTLVRLKLHLHLLSTELHLMRSAFSLTSSHLNEAISTARTFGLFDEFASRIALDWGLFAVVKGDNEEAVSSFETVMQLEEPSSELYAIASLSKTLLGVSMGVPPSSLALPPSSTPSVNTDLPPNLSLLMDVTRALTADAITESKKHLSSALNTANEGARNHSKCLLLALLANVFLCTRNDQAQKMLSASLHIARGMSARVPSSDPDKKGEENVGNAKLGLWVGERLLEGYKKEAQGKTTKIQDQETLNEVHRRVVDKEKGELEKMSAEWK
ncbi:Cohesin loading factor [Pseudohyphozyma bogoriensis]|nr:Cohesin loading factor [Pseudohyphozyma bogoriensis]